MLMLDVVLGVDRLLDQQQLDGFDIKPDFLLDLSLDSSLRSFTKLDVAARNCISSSPFVGPHEQYLLLLVDDERTDSGFRVVLNQLKSILGGSQVVSRQWNSYSCIFRIIN